MSLQTQNHIRHWDWMRITGMKFETRMKFGLVFPIIRSFLTLLFPTYNRIAQLWAIDADLLMLSLGELFFFGPNADEGIFK